MHETREEGRKKDRSALVPWRWPLSIATLAVLVWFAYEILGGAGDGGMRKQSFGLLLLVGVFALLAWTMGSGPKK